MCGNSHICSRISHNPALEVFKLHGDDESLHITSEVARGASNLVASIVAKLRLRVQLTVQDQGVRLASNQVQYSLLYREPERNGVMKACQELGVTLIAYSPLCQGLLTGA